MSCAFVATLCFESPFIGIEKIVMGAIMGTGKSKTIEAMSCWGEKILTKAGDHPEKPRVLIMAPSGKAAANVGKQ